MPLLIVGCICSSKVLSQCNLPALEKPVPIMLRVKLVPNGFIELPAGAKVADTGGKIDYWLRTITFDDSYLKINVSAGLVESVFDDFIGSFTCTETAQIGKNYSRFAVAKKSGKEYILAKVFWTQFIAEVTSNKEKALFGYIVRSYTTK
ncbi:MAG TPA: hypothetical protein PKA82_16345 [Pyrinomonadaceae bacterium]|nr:hypothetical protein [Pyrinomonadaceae bacterium]